MQYGPVKGDHGMSSERHEAPTRRHFLRRAGIIGAVATAFIGGGADLAGIPASASAKSKRGTNGGPGVCTYAKGHCGSGCSSGFCCYRCQCGTKVSYGCQPARRPGCSTYTINCV